MSYIHSLVFLGDIYIYLVSYVWNCLLYNVISTPNFPFKLKCHFTWNRGILVYSLKIDWIGKFILIYCLILFQTH